jgi:hypothetical protein
MSCNRSRTRELLNFKVNIYMFELMLVKRNRCDLAYFFGGNDITGGGEGAVLDKVNKLNSWIVREQENKKNSKLSLNAVVIAPFVK